MLESNMVQYSWIHGDDDKRLKWQLARLHESISLEEPSRGRYGIPLRSNSSRTSSGSVPFTLQSVWKQKETRTSQRIVLERSLSAPAILKPKTRLDLWGRCCPPSWRLCRHEHWTWGLDSWDTRYRWILGEWGQWNRANMPAGLCAGDETCRWVQTRV